MAKATWNGHVLAESDVYEIVENNIYFPLDSTKKEFFEKSETETSCPWKGIAYYYHIQVEGKVNVDAAWYYPDPKEAAANIKNHVAFWRGVEVIK